MTYFTTSTSDYFKFTGKIFETKAKEKELDDVSNISKSRKNSDLKTKSATLVELKAEQDKIMKLHTFDSSISLVQVMLKMMAHKIISCFSQSVNNFKKLLIAIYVIVKIKSIV